MSRSQKEMPDTQPWQPIQINYDVSLLIPRRFDRPGSCQVCGRRLPILSRWLGSDAAKVAHDDCYRNTVAEKKQAYEEYRQSLRTALAKGAMGDWDRIGLLNLKNKLGLTQHEVDKVQLLAFHDLFAGAVEDRVLTEQEDKMLSQAKEELKLDDGQLQPYLSVLARLRFIREIQEGHLPTITPTILLKRSEIAHFHCMAEFWEERVTQRGYEGGSHGVSIRIAKGVYYRVGAHKGRLVTETGIVKVDQGTLVITNQRIVFNGFAKSFSIPMGKLINYVVYEDAIQLDKEGKAKPAYFKVEDPEIAAVLISAIAQKT